MHLLLQYYRHLFVVMLQPAVLDSRNFAVWLSVISWCGQCCGSVSHHLYTGSISASTFSYFVNSFLKKLVFFSQRNIGFESWIWILMRKKIGAYRYQDVDSTGSGFTTLTDILRVVTMPIFLLFSFSSSVSHIVFVFCFNLSNVVEDTVPTYKQCCWFVIVRYRFLRYLSGSEFITRIRFRPYFYIKIVFKRF